MPRSSQPVDDRTPIAGSRLDVGARTGWLLRTHRTVAGRSLREMSAALRENGVSLSPASLSRIEGEGQLSTAALDGYAAVLGLPLGFPRACAELLLINFGRDRLTAGPAHRATLEEFSGVCEAVSSGIAGAGTWLRFARLHQGDSGFGLPAGLMRRELERLAAETARSLTPGRMVRRLTLMVLRRSAYGDLVREVAERTIADPDFQGHWDVMDILCVQPSGELIEWGGQLLSDKSTYTVLGATFLLQSMLRSTGLQLSDWERLVPHLELAWNRAGEDAARRAALTRMCAALPPPLQAQLRGVCSPDSVAPTTPRTWSRDRGNRHYVYAESLAREACARRGHPEEPLLARLLFEAFFDPRGVRMSNATVLLAGSPFASEVVRVILERRDSAPDHASWVAALRVAAFCHLGEDTPGTDQLLASTELAELLHGLMIASRLDEPLADAVVRRGLGGDELLVRRTLYCLGMQGDAVRLGEIAADPANADWVRGGARWWRDQGPRILD